MNAAMPSPTGAASRCETVFDRRPDAVPFDLLHRDRGGDHERHQDRLGPVAFDAAMKGVPDEVDQDRPHHRVDQDARAVGTALPAQQSDKPMAPSIKTNGVAIPICAAKNSPK